MQWVLLAVAVAAMVGTLVLAGWPLPGGRRAGGVQQQWPDWAATQGAEADPWEQLPDEDKSYLRWFFK